MDKETVEFKPKKTEVFFQVVKIGRVNKNDFWEAFQIERVWVEGSKVVKRELFDKPDTKQMIMAKAELMIDPQSEWEDFERFGTGEIGEKVQRRV